MPTICPLGGPCCSTGLRVERAEHWRRGWLTIGPGALGEGSGCLVGKGKKALAEEERDGRK